MATSRCMCQVAHTFNETAIILNCLPPSQQLPTSLTDWRNGYKGTGFYPIWKTLCPFFIDHGFHLWKPRPGGSITLYSPNMTLPCPGSIYASPVDPESFDNLHYFSPRVRPLRLICSLKINLPSRRTPFLAPLVLGTVET